jgi:hypothetical protein
MNRNLRHLVFTSTARLTIGISILTLPLVISAQVNSWIKPSSGNWEESQWSLGALPGSGQSVMITNGGVKAVTVSANTTQNHPQTLTVDSVTISSPANSSNALVMNNAGFQTPLTARLVTVANNSAFSLTSSALRLNGGPGAGMSVGGQFDQSLSDVSGQQLDVGYIGPGIYNLNSGSLAVNQMWIGGFFGGVFNQTGGSNGVGIVHLDGGGAYNFSGGAFSATVYSDSGSLFRQLGGVLDANLSFWKGDYRFEAGEKRGDLVLPAFAFTSGSAAALQLGGTNAGSIYLGGDAGVGSYTLSNGVVTSPTISVGKFGGFHQEGSLITTTGTVSVVGGYVDRGGRALGYFTLDNGALSCPAIYMDTGSFTQNGGTNTVAGDLYLTAATHNFYYLNGGLLNVNNTALGASWAGGFFQSNGIHQVANQLSIAGNGLYFWNAYVMSGGQLLASNISISNLGMLKQTGGSIAQNGLLSLLNARISVGPGAQQFGRLQLNGDGDATNTTLQMPNNTCVLNFNDSSSLTWSNTATLEIQNWAGAPFGHGTHQIIFGNSDSALTTEQLNQIFFRDPPGQQPGLYAAQILSNGEIVPNALPPTGRVPPTIRLAQETNGTLRITVLGESGSDYGIEVSTNLVNWVAWTNGIAFSGTMSVIDTPSTNYPPKFYRAVLLP